MPDPSTLTSAQFLNRWSIVEELAGGPATDGVVFTPSVPNPTTETMTPTSTPPASYYSSQIVTLTGGAATVDLTAIPSSQGDIDATGKKVQRIRIQHAAASQHALTVSPGASNAYALFGAGNDFVLPPDGVLDMRFGDNLADVAAGAKEIDFAGTADETFYLELVIG